MVSTDVAAMGLDVRDLNLSINIGTLVMDSHPGLYNIISKSGWKLKQQAGRVGRNGSPALDIVLVYPQRGIY